MFIQALKDKYQKMKDTSGLTHAQLETRVKWARRGALIAGVCLVTALGITAAGVTAAVVIGTGASAKLGLSAAFMAASSAVKSFISNRICTALQSHYEKEQIKRGEKKPSLPPPSLAKEGVTRLRNVLGKTFNNGMKAARKGLGGQPPKSGFVAPKV